MDTTQEVGTSSDRCYLVSRDQLALVWGRIDELLQQHPAGLTEFYEPEDIFQQVMMDSSYEVWVVVEQGCIVAASIWCLARYPKKSVYSCYWLGGTGLRKHYHHTMETLLSYCKACHIDELAFNGRKGWALLLAPWDFKLSVRLTKDVRMKWRH